MSLLTEGRGRWWCHSVLTGSWVLGAGEEAGEKLLTAESESDQDPLLPQKERPV